MQLSKSTATLRTDDIIKLVLIGLLAIHFIVLILSFSSKKFLAMISILNVGLAISVLVYWIRKYMITGISYAGVSEMSLVIGEIIVLISGIMLLMMPHPANYLKGAHYLFFGIHILIMLLFLAFMLFFKMNKLF